MRSRKSGQTLVELMLVSGFVCLSIFSFWQLELLLQRRCALRYAAFHAARTASVWSERLTPPQTLAKSHASASAALSIALGQRPMQNPLQLQQVTLANKNKFLRQNVRTELTLNNHPNCVGNDDDTWIRCHFLSRTKMHYIMPTWLAPKASKP